MKTMLARRAAALLAAAALALGGWLGTPAPASAQGVTDRPISEFVNAQGTFDIGFLVVPPVPNFFGWSDPDSGLSISIDYAGLADATCHGVAGTTFSGSIKEKTLPDGRAEVTVELFTDDAITWVIDGFDFSSDPVVFGARWEEIQRGKNKGDCVFNGPLALGDSTLRVKFINARPGDPIPDLVQLIIFPDEGQELLEIAFEGWAMGKDAAGDDAVATVKQVAKVMDGELRFLVEEVTLNKAP